MGGVIPRGGVGLRKSVYGVWVLAALVVVDTGTVGCAGSCSPGHGAVALNAVNINFGVVWTKATCFL